MVLETMLLAILIGAGLLVVSILTSLISFRVGAPLLLVFLAVGLLAGEDGPGGLQFSDPDLAFFIGSLALAIILFDSGFGTRARTLRSAAGPAVLLATAGVALTAVFLAVPAHYLLRLGWLEALLLGSIVGSTDAAAVFFLLRVGGIEIRDRVRSTLEVESASNDPMAIFLVTVLIEAILAGGGAAELASGFVTSFVLQMGLGLTLGAVGGYLMVLGVSRTPLEPALYPLVILASALLLYALVSMLGGSGFLAIYVAGLVAGNTISARGVAHFRQFQEGMTWLCQIVMFLTLGLLATPSQFGVIALPVMSVAIALILLARPLAVTLLLLPFGFRRNEVVFISWVGLRGAVSILLGILPILGGIPQGQLLFNAAFIIVLVSLLVQGWTIRPMAQWLGLAVPPTIGPLEKVQLELPGTANHELVAYRIAPKSPVARGERIPRWARPSLVVRNGQSMRVHQAGHLQPGDYVYIFTVPSYIHLLDRLFASPAKLSVRDREFWGDLAVEPGRRIRDLARAYGSELEPTPRDMTVAEFLKDRLGGRAEIGDRATLDSVELVVRGVSEDGDVEEVGLILVGDDDEERGTAGLITDWLRRLLTGQPRRGESEAVPAHELESWARRSEPGRPNQERPAEVAEIEVQKTQPTNP
jgi:potassium/hydrogen antiporter